MATRFYFDTSTSPPVNPPFDGGWEQTGSTIRGKLAQKNLLTTATALADTTVTTAITTSQDYLIAQFTSEPLPATGWLSSPAAAAAMTLVVRVSESVATVNAVLAILLKVVSQDGQTSRGNLFANFAVDTEWAVAGSDATRIANQSHIAMITQGGDRLVLEIGAHLASPSTSGSVTMRFGMSAASDFALTSGLTTDLNPWLEVGETLRATRANNYQFIKVGDGMSVSERIR